MDGVSASVSIPNLTPKRCATKRLQGVRQGRYFLYESFEEL